MKNKKVLYIAIAIVVAAIAILFVVKVLPPAPEEQTSGTIGKVDKYRKLQMTEKDVILRKELSSDTSSLAKSINGLVFFNAVIKQYSKDMKVFSDYLNKNEPDLKQNKAINEYIAFIDNNVGSIENTIGLLTDLYSGDTSDYSIDIEKKLKDFDSFVSSFVRKDSVITVALSELEGRIDNKITSAADKNEGIKKLVNVHDQLLLRNFRLNLLLGNNGSIGSFMNKSLYNANNVGSIIANQVNLGDIILNKTTLNEFCNKGNLGIFNKTNLNNILNKGNLGVFNKVTLNGIFNTGAINAICNTGSLGQGYYSNNGGLGAYNNKGGLGQGTNLGSGAVGNKGGLGQGTNLGSGAVGNKGGLGQLVNLGMVFNKTLQSSIGLQFGGLNSKQLQNTLNSYLGSTTLSNKLNNTIGSSQLYNQSLNAN